MALGDVIVLDDVSVSLGGTDISAAVATARIHVTYHNVEVPHTMGRNWGPTKTSDKYRWMVDLDIQTDAFGSSNLDGIVSSKLPAPLGTGSGETTLSILPTGSGKTYSGTVSLSEWEPLGTGTTGEIISQTRTFTGAGALSVSG